MRRIRSRLTILLYILVILTSLLSIFMFSMAQNGRFLQREQVRFLLFGYAAKDVLLLIVALCAMALLILLTSRSTTNPIRELNRAAKEIAAGNFDVTVNIRDRVEELGELEASFNRMAAELRSNDYLRKDFISNASHELKTPLSILNGYAKLLEEPELSPEERKEYAASIAAESDRLVRLVDNMLRLSRIDNRHIPPNNETFSLSEQVRRVILQLEPRFEKKNLRLDADIDEISFHGDRELLGHIWTNLLDNAIKFSPGGGVISVYVKTDAPYLRVEVRDQGPGMTPETMARIFEQFYRGDTEHAREGSGLGLPLAKRIAELHDGEITVESQPECGSRFMVTLPLINSAAV